MAGHRVMHTPSNGHERRRPRDIRGMDRAWLSCLQVGRLRSAVLVRHCSSASSCNVDAAAGDGRELGDITDRS